MVVESEVLNEQNCALSKFSLPVHSNGQEKHDLPRFVIDIRTISVEAPERKNGGEQ